MALWQVNRLRSKTTVLYVNLRTGQRHDVGDQRPDTPTILIFDWLAEHADPGDWIAVDGSITNVIQHPARA